VVGNSNPPKALDIQLVIFYKSISPRHEEREATFWENILKEMRQGKPVQEVKKHLAPGIRPEKMLGVLAS